MCILFLQCEYGFYQFVEYSSNRVLTRIPTLSPEAEAVHIQLDIRATDAPVHVQGDCWRATFELAEGERAVLVAWDFAATRPEAPDLVGRGTWTVEVHRTTTPDNDATEQHRVIVASESGGLFPQLDSRSPSHHKRANTSYVRVLEASDAKTFRLTKSWTMPLNGGSAWEVGSDQRVVVDADSIHLALDEPAELVVIFSPLPPVDLGRWVNVVRGLVGAGKIHLAADQGGRHIPIAETSGTEVFLLKRRAPPHVASRDAVEAPAERNAMVLWIQAEL